MAGERVDGMWQAIGKYVGGKVLGAVVFVASAMALIWYWQLPPESKAAIWEALRDGLVWIAFVTVWPWALFFVPAVAVRAESNLFSALMLLGYWAADIFVALWLAGWRVSGALAWAVLSVGFLAAGVYNFVVCEYLACRAEDR